MAKKKNPTVPRYQYLNQDWAGPDTANMAITRAMFNVPGSARFSPSNFGYPPGTTAPQDVFSQSSNWMHDEDGWEYPLGESELARNTQNNRSLVLRAGDNAGSRYASRPSSSQVLAQMVRDGVSRRTPGEPLLRRPARAAVRRRTDMAAHREITQAQSVPPPVPLRDILWGPRP